MVRVTMLALAAVLLSNPPRATQPPRQPQSLESVTIVATDYRFEPSEIHATADAPLRVTLVNKGKAVHGLRFELSDREFPLPTNVPPGRSETAVIDSVGSPGRYAFFCPVENHRDRGMTGVLIVEPKK